MGSSTNKSKRRAKEMAAASTFWNRKLEELSAIAADLQLRQQVAKELHSRYLSGEPVGRKEFNREVDLRLSRVVEMKVPSPYEGILALPLHEMELSAIPYNRLKSESIHYVGDLVQLTEVSVANIKNLGPKSLAEIKEALAALGLTFKT